MGALSRLIVEAPYLPFADVDARIAETIRVPARLSVPEAALKWRVLDNPGGGYSGPWTFETAQHLRRPMDCLTPDSGYSTVAAMGPAQSGKSDVGNNWLLHAILCDPADMLMVAPDKALCRDYVVHQINKMIRLTPALRDRMLDTPGADNIFSKEFLGMMFFATWPVASQLRARPISKTRIDDYDAIDRNIEGEGELRALLAARQTTFEGFEMEYVNSSPALGADFGIEALVANGTDERWWVRCWAGCGEPFRLAFDEVLRFERSGSPQAAEQSAVVVCPHCGGVHEPAHKRALMSTGAWVGPEQKMAADGTVTGPLRDVPIASFRIDGLMGFSSWGRLARLWREAELAFERAQDDGELWAVYQTRVGVNYKSRLSGADPVTAEELAERAGASGYAQGTVPAWVECLTAAVDIQGNRFEVLVVGWGAGLRSAIVDRFPIIGLDDGETAVDPGGRPEHWLALIGKVIRRRYPVAGRDGWSLPVLNTAIDTGGVEGVTDNAFQFWHAAMRRGIRPTMLTLVKGGNKASARLLPPPTIDAKRQIKGAPQAELFVPNVNRFKDIVDARLRREDDGPGWIAFPRDFDPAYMAELTAERRNEDGQWYRIAKTANETLDLMVYCTTALMRFAGSDTSLDFVPAWARPKPEAVEQGPRLQRYGARRARKPGRLSTSSLMAR